MLQLEIARRDLTRALQERNRVGDAPGEEQRQTQHLFGLAMLHRLRRQARQRRAERLDGRGVVVGVIERHAEQLLHARIAADARPPAASSPLPRRALVDSVRASDRSDAGGASGDWLSSPESVHADA